MRVSTNAPPSSNSSSNFEFQQMAAALEDKMTLTFRNEMNEMKNMMKALVPTPAPIKAVEERCTTCGNNHSFNVCPMTRGGYESPVYHDNFQQFQQTASVGNFVQNGNAGYRPPNLANHTHPLVFLQTKKTTEGSMQAMRNHITNLKAEIRSEVQATLQNQINSLKGEFKNELKSQHNLFMNQQNDFQNNLQNMLSGFFQNQSQPSTSTSMVPTTLPSNTITNPRCEARAITTRSGLSYTPVPPIPPPLYDENEPLTEKETEVTKDKVLPSTKDIQPPVIQKSHDPVKPVSSPISPEPSSAQVDNSPPSKEPSKKTRLPYPSRVEHEKKGENDKMLKSLLSNKEKLNEMANTPVSETCSAIILKKLPEKLGDPGQFLIPCDFSELKCKALADLGASINLMPFSVYTKLGLPALQSTRMTLELANCSLCVPKGIAKMSLVRGKFYFPGRLCCSRLLSSNYQVPLRLDDEEIISIEASSIISPKVDVKTIMSFFAPIGNCVRKWATKEIAFLDGLLEDENFFETNDKKVEFLERKTKEDFETKVESEKKKELQVFHPDIETLNHLETNSYVGSDYVFYEDFNLVDMIFPMNIQGKIFDPGD
ncbi:reverse transcriptase domain-containing protein [Tanacetum coccineum]